MINNEGLLKDDKLDNNALLTLYMLSKNKYEQLDKFLNENNININSINVYEIDAGGSRVRVNLFNLIKDKDGVEFLINKGLKIDKALIIRHELLMPILKSNNFTKEEKQLALKSNPLLFSEYDPEYGYHIENNSKNLPNLSFEDLSVLIEYGMKINLYQNEQMADMGFFINDGFEFINDLNSPKKQLLDNLLKFDINRDFIHKSELPDSNTKLTREQSIVYTYIKNAPIAEVNYVDEQRIHDSVIRGDIEKLKKQFEFLKSNPNIPNIDLNKLAFFKPYYIDAYETENNSHYLLNEFTKLDMMDVLIENGLDFASIINENKYTRQYYFLQDFFKNNLHYDNSNKENVTKWVEKHEKNGNFSSYDANRLKHRIHEGLIENKRLMVVADEIKNKKIKDNIKEALTTVFYEKLDKLVDIEIVKQANEMKIEENSDLFLIFKDHNFNKIKKELIDNFDETITKQVEEVFNNSDKGLLKENTKKTIKSDDNELTL